MRILILVVSLQVVLSHDRTEDGVLYKSTVERIQPYSGLSEVVSIDYPQPAPHSTIQIWRYIAFNGDTKPKALRLNCYHISIPKVGDSCGKFSFKMKDGERETEYCGEVDPFSVKTATGDVTWTLKTGPGGGAKVNCTVEAAYKDERRQKRAARLAYLDVETVEIDSDEDGGVAGPKRTTCPCGWANKVSSRIVNGTETREHEFPFMAGLILLKDNWRFCGATIITVYHAISAGHCTLKKEANQLGLLVGAHDLKKERKDPTELIPLKAFINHENYDSGVWSYDLTLLVLKKKITFGQFVGPACLPTTQLQLDGQYVKITGWGADKSGGKDSPVLMKVNVRVVPPKECASVYKSVNAEKPLHICTYRRRRASCAGDSGGPVVWLDPETNRYTLVGAVAFGRICGDESPSVHTAIGAFLDWIRQRIKETTPEEVCTKVN